MTTWGCFSHFGFSSLSFYQKLGSAKKNCLKVINTRNEEQDGNPKIMKIYLCVASISDSISKNE